MRFRIPATIAAVILFAVPDLGAQALPTTRAAVPAYDVELVHRLMKLLDAPEHWNRRETGKCAASATSFSIICAIQRIVDSSAAEFRTNDPSATECRFQRTSAGVEGSCGLLFLELPIFTVARVQGVATGKWRDDAMPIEVWSGVMNAAGAPLMEEARRAIDDISTKKYSARLVGFNNDSAVTFAVLQKYLGVLADRVASNALADFAQGGDSVEVEIYAGGTGAIRTYEGWYPVTKFSATSDAVRFQMDASTQVAPNAMDKRILERAATIISSDAVWNRADDRKCPASATTWSIYCAVEKATIEVTGGFHHRRPAGELVRLVVEERTNGKAYAHRMMGYNNDRATTLSDVRSLFAEAIRRI